MLMSLECRGLAPAGNIIREELSTANEPPSPHVSWKRTSQTVSLSRLDNLHGHSALRGSSCHSRKECSTRFTTDAESKEKKRLPRLVNLFPSSSLSPFLTPLASESSLICLKTGTSHDSEPNRE